MHHDPRDEAGLEWLGTTTRGTEVRVNREILEKDAILSFGAILHHYFAGFGGGRKLFFPGLAAYDSILHNHSLFLDFANRRLDPGCQSGRLEGNPLAEDLEEIYRMLPPHLEIHGILNSRKEVCEIHFGLDYGQFRRATEYYDGYFRVTGTGASGTGAPADLFDLVVASAGGYPKDINYIQAHKSIHNAASFVRDGGTLLILAQCIDGVGNRAFTELFSLAPEGSGSPEMSEAIYQAMEKQYKNNAGTALSTLEKTRRIRIRFVTELDQESCRLMGYEKTSPEEARELVAGIAGRVDAAAGTRVDAAAGTRVALIQNASLLYR